MAGPNDRSQDSSRQRQSCSQPFSRMFVFSWAAQSSWEHEAISIFRQGRLQWIQFANGKDNSLLKSVIKTTGLTLIPTPEAPLKDFQSFFYSMLFAPKLKSFLIVP